MSVGEIIAGLGGGAVILGIGKLVFSSGEMSRMVKETHGSVNSINTKIDDHGTRILKLEMYTGINEDQRHFVRRTDDQVLRDVRNMANGDNR